MIVLADNDILIKLCASRLDEKFLVVIQKYGIEIQCLPSLKYKTQKEIVKGKLDATIGARILVLLEAITQLTQKPNTESFQYFQNIAGIDVGEAQLISGVLENSNAYIMTGDKRALKALHNSEIADSYRNALIRRAICYEQVLLWLTEEFQFDEMLPGLVEGASYDTSQRALVGMGSATKHSSFKEGLESYIRNLQQQTGEYLVTQRPF